MILTSSRITFPFFSSQLLASYLPSFNFIEFSPKEIASKFYEKVTDKVQSIDVAQVKDSVKGSLQAASSRISNVWQGLQVSSTIDLPTGR